MGERWTGGVSGAKSTTSAAGLVVFMFFVVGGMSAVYFRRRIDAVARLAIEDAREESKGGQKGKAAAGEEVARKDDHAGVKLKVNVNKDKCVGCWMCVMVCPFGAPQPFRQFRKMIKCDRCTGMDAPFCVESCPTRALLLIDPDEMARGAVRLRTPSLTGLDFVSTRTLSKPEV